MSRIKYLSTSEILKIIENCSDDEDSEVQLDNLTNLVIIPPPNAGEVSDEEDIDEDEITINEATDINPLNEIAGTVELEYTSDINDFGVGEDEAIVPSCSTYRPKSDFVPKWKRTKRMHFDIAPDHEPLDEIKDDIVSKLGGHTPYQLFCLFFDDEITQHLVNETNRYAAQHNSDVNIVDMETMRRFFGILLFSGYHSVPQVQNYWSNEPTYGIPIIKQTMSRNKFQKIKSNFHLANNDEIDKNDKFAKVRPLFDLLNARFMQFGVFEPNLLIDEQMVPYFGRHSCKMFIRGKPIRFGYKYWCLCSSKGYLYQFRPYAGATDTYDKQLGLGASVVLSLLSVCKHPGQHTVHFYNFFTGYHLLCLLKEKGFCATGTIRANRLANAGLKTNLAKHDIDYAFDQIHKISVVRWRDNAEVTLATNYDQMDPIRNVMRYDRKEKKKIAVPQANLIANYNKYMGGVDLHDNAVANYRIGIRGKKWWWPLWVTCLDSACVNAWKLHCMISEKTNKKSMPQIDFKNSITKTLLLYETIPPDEESDGVDDTAEQPTSSKRVKAMHMSVSIKGCYRRCKICKKHTAYTCAKCNINLHVGECFETYHANLK